MSLDINPVIKTKLASGELFDIYEKINFHQRLTSDDGLMLYNSNDILAIGGLADFAKVKRLEKLEKLDQKDHVYWINNYHLNLTNICEGKCKFCAFRKQNGENGSYFISLDQAKNHIKTKIDKNIKELHIVSALNKNLDINYYIELFKYCKKIFPSTHIQALTAVEIDYLAKQSELSIEDTLKKLMKAGLGSLPGGGAEVFSQAVREKFCPEKISGQKWLNIMQVAHSIGLNSNATMLCGIGESFEEKLNHMLELRNLQDVTNGFMAFIPLFCHYKNTELSFYKEKTGIEILKEYAIARLMLDNIDHVKAFWIQIGVKLAQISLSFGVDDIDGTVGEEKITHSAGAETEQVISRDSLINLIKKSSKIPVERDTIYNLIKVYQ